VKREIALVIAWPLAILILSITLWILFPAPKPEALRNQALLLLSDYDTGAGTIYIRYMYGFEYHDIPITGGREEVEAVKRHMQEIIR
jgi:hypothetical protein